MTDVIADDDEEGEEGEEGEEKMPSCGDYIMHFLTLPWKLIFALIPPTGMIFTLINKTERKISIEPTNNLRTRKYFTTGCPKRGRL